MSKLELHISDYKHTMEYLAEHYDVLALGDEGCMYYVPLGEEALKLARKIINSGHMFKYVTPKVSDGNFTRLLETIRLFHIAELDYTIVINDLGILYEASHQKILPKMVSLGRSIARTLQDTAWAEEFVDEKNGKIELLTNTLADSMKYKLFTKYGVNGMDANLFENSSYGFQRLFDWGWNVSVHIRNYSIAFARKCAYAKYKKLNVGDCVGSCREGIDISMDQICDFNEHRPCVNKLQADIVDFTLIGNVLYRKNKAYLDLVKDSRIIYSYVIHDYELDDTDIDQIRALL
ncbi:hypothetical protein [Anaerosporobacter faecicola]|uniref:hypothetical protein n=1 Tax=Anaerosporobacter faecicola TaxID=2718714 RepID=UPI0014393AAF|nr:hypothetical protein [Anaerosporobacter faecicola]